MATVVHETGAGRIETERESSGAGWFVAAIALVAIVVLFLLAGAYFNRAGTGTNVNVPSTPNTTNEGVNNSGQVDVNAGADASYQIPSSGVVQ